MLDLNLLRLMKHRKAFYELYPIVPKGKPLDDLTVQMLANFDKYFHQFPTHKSLDLNTFVGRFRMWYPQLPEDRMNAFIAVIRNMIPEPDEDTKENIIRDLAELNLMTVVANYAHQHNEGDLSNGAMHIMQALDDYKIRTGLRGITYIDTPIDVLLRDEFDDAGLKWRLNCLNESMRGLRPGDFGIIAGRPDKGKTSFISSEVTNMASQLPADKNILWLNNEGMGRRIIPRLYQSATGFSMKQMMEHSNNGTLVPAYETAIGGRLDRIRVVDIHGLNNGQVESILEQHNPGVVVYDMIDNIRGFGDSARTDLQLEEMYKWARERSVKYECVGLATSQISNDGDGLQFPTLGMLKDSKTGKQGACDFQLMIGASNDPIFNSSRFISLPKNKLRRPEGKGDPRAEVLFQSDICRYMDIKVE